MLKLNKFKAIVKKGLGHTVSSKRCNISHSGTEFEVQMWAVSEFIASKIIPVTGCHPFPLTELSLMVAAVTYLKPDYIFEWGTNIGKSARIFYETCSFFGINSQIHSIDLPDDHKHCEHPGSERGIFVRKISEVKLHQGDGAETAIRIGNDIDFKNDSCLYFLDGDHSYASVKRELDLIYSHNLNANFLVHDTFFQSEQAGYNIGPHLAVRDFLDKTPNVFFGIDAKLGLPGMTLIYQKRTK